MKSPFYGAQTILYCAINPATEKDTGLYYYDCTRRRPSNDALKKEDQKRLWILSEQTVGLNRDIQMKPMKKSAIM